MYDVHFVVNIVKQLFNLVSFIVSQMATITTRNNKDIKSIFSANVYSVPGLLNYACNVSVATPTSFCLSKLYNWNY